MEPYCDFYCVHCVHMFPLRWVNPQRIFAALLDGFRKTADLRDAFARRVFADRALPYSDGDTYWLWDVVRLCRGHCVQYSVRVCDYMVPEKHRRLQRCAACLLWTGHVPDYRYCGMLAECLRLARRDGIVWPAEGALFSFAGFLFTQGPSLETQLREEKDTIPESVVSVLRSRPVVCSLIWLMMITTIDLAIVGSATQMTLVFAVPAALANLTSGIIPVFLCIGRLSIGKLFDTVGNNKKHTTG